MITVPIWPHSVMPTGRNRLQTGEGGDLSEVASKFLVPRVPPSHPRRNQKSYQLFQLNSSAQAGDYRPLGVPFRMMDKSTDPTAANTFHHYTGSFNLRPVNPGDPLNIAAGTIRVGTITQFAFNVSTDRRSFNASYSGQTHMDNLQVTVPEPTSLSLLALGGLALIRRRRK